MAAKNKKLIAEQHRQKKIAQAKAEGDKYRNQSGIKQLNSNYQAFFNRELKRLALKYYGADDLSMLAPHQLDKITTWVSKMNPEAGKNKSRKAEMALRQNKKFTGKRRHEHNENKLKG